MRGAIYRRDLAAREVFAIGALQLAVGVVQGLDGEGGTPLKDDASALAQLARVRDSFAAVFEGLYVIATAYSIFQCSSPV